MSNNICEKFTSSSNLIVGEIILLWIGQWMKLFQIWEKPIETMFQLFFFKHIFIYENINSCSSKNMLRVTWNNRFIAIISYL